METFTKNLRWLLASLLLVVGMSSAWADDVTYTLTISASDFNTTSYAANNNEKTSYAVCTTDATKTYEVKWTSNQVMKNSSNMQWQKSKGYIYNSTDLGTINSVTVNSSAGSFTTYYGTSEHPTSGTTVGNGFFTTAVGSATGTTSSIVISFTISEGGSSTATPTTTTIDASGITNTDVYKGTAAGSLSASVVDEDDAAVSGATVTWSGNNDAVATIDASTGAVTLVAAGSVTFTASYAGVQNEYAASSATYQMTVTDTTPFSGGDVTFNGGVDLGTTTTNADGDAVTKSGVTISSTSAAFATSEYRMYKNSETTISLSNELISSGYVITSITFTGTSSNPASGFATQEGWETDGNNGTWTGSETSVSFTASGAQVRATKIVVTVEATTPKVLESITLSGDYPTTFHVGDAFSHEGIVVTATYDNASTKDVTASATFSGYDMATAGAQTVTVTYNEGEVTKTATYGITVNAPATLTSITLSGTYPTAFDQGDAFSSAGIVVTANFDDNTTSDVTAEATFSGYDMSTLGEQTVTVSYGEKTATYTITVNEKKGTADNPYTVAQARAAIDAGTGVTGVYATGIVSAIPTAYNSTYSNITFNFVDNDGDEVFLQAYRCGGTLAADVQVGDIVVVSGNLTKYGSTYEFGSGCQVVSLTHPVVTTPYFTADNVDITYDATAGAVAYTVENAVAGGSVTASTTSTWLTLGNDYTSPIAFTCDANTAAAARTATVTLTYTYGNSETVTKDVTVTQAGNPNVINNISDITEVGTDYTVRGTVVATNSRGFVIGDGTGYAYIYLNAAPSYSVGDNVKVSGTTGSYGHVIQFTSSATIEAVTESNYNGDPQPTVITEVPDYSEGYHLSTYLQFEGTLDNNIVTVGESQIRITYPTTDQTTALTELDGKTVRVHGFFSGISGSGTSAIFTVTMESVEEVIDQTPTLSADDIALTYEAQTGVKLYYTVTNPMDGVFIGVNTSETASWVKNVAHVSNGAETGGTRYEFDVEENTGDAPRETTITLTYGSLTKVVTITQAAYVVDYATLPFAWDDKSTPTGVTNSGVGTYNASPYLKFDTTDDIIILKLNERPGTLTFDIKGNNFSGGTFTVQTSEDGATYTDLATYTDSELGNTTLNESFDNLGENVRYIKWIYTEKATGNVALGNIAVAKYATPTPTITLNQYEYNLNAQGGDAVLPVVCTNMPAAPQLAVVFCDANGDAVAVGTYDWITATINNEGNIAGHIDANTGDARTAYFKVSGVDADNNTVYSELVTINQAAPAEPYITMSESSINFDAAGGSKTLSFEYESLGNNPTFYVQFFESDGITETECGWITCEFASNDNKVTITGANNDESSDRTAYFKVYAEVNKTKIYSDLVTVNQPAYVVDYAELPFEWAGGASADLKALNGITTNSLGSDYSDTHAPYLVKFDGDGDYIQVKTNEQPGVVTIDVKMVGGATSSTITVQGSADGQTFTDVETLTISGTQNSVVNLETTTAFAATDRYVRLLFTKGSNVGVGPITIAKFVAPLPDPELSFGATTEFTVAPGADFTAPTLTTASGFDGTIVYSSSDENIVLVDENTGDVVIGDTEGSVVITATSEATANFKDGSASYTINVVDNREVPIFEFAESSITKNIGDADFTNPINCPANITINYTSSNDNVALVTDGVVTIGDPGTTTITATFDGNDTYKPATASYTLKVIDPAHPEEEIYPVVFYESFDNFTGRGGNKDAEGDTEWNGITGSTDLTSSSDYDNAGWEPTKGYEAYQCVRFGTGSAKGIITTPAIAFDAGYTYTLTFLAGAWDGTKEETTLKLSVSTGEISESSVTLAKGVWTSYTVTISNAEPNSTITFAANTTSNNRFFLDEVKVVSTTATTVPTEDADMIAGKTADGTENDETVHYASYVTTYDVDMIYTEDVEAYIITGTEGSTLTMKKVRQIPAGTAVILKSKVNQTFTLCESPFAFANAEGDCEGNQLKASDGTAETTDTETLYVLSKGKTGDGKPGFYRLAAGRTIPAGKAYLAVPASSAKAFFGFTYDEEATAIEVVDAAIEPTEQVIYTLAGQRVQTMTKGGIYIVNGKKVFVK